MNAKNTWTWLIMAAGLFAFILFFERYLRPPLARPAQVLPGFNAASVTSISVVPAGQLEIRAERTNAAWQLTKPIVYPARSVVIENLLGALERLTWTNYITAGELRERTNTDEQFGFDPAQVKLIIQQNDRSQILIGNRTPPGDQMYVQVVNSPGVYVVDAGLLKLIPRTTNDWRDTAFVDLRRLAFDRIIVSVSTGAKPFVELQRDATNNLWRMTRPLAARADNNRIAESLQKLLDLNVSQFVTDNPTDLDRFGLQPAELELAMASGTNMAAVLQFGRSPTNDASLVFARRSGVNSVVAVAKAGIAPWLATIDDYRDPHLVALDAPIDQIEVRAEDSFLLQRQPDDTWRLASPDLPADGELVNEFENALATMQITQFKNAVTAPDRLAYGLAAPAYQIILRSAVTNAAGVTNVVCAQLAFGTNQEAKVFAQRSDEDSVYGVNLADFQRLPSAGWRLRERRIWSFSENDVARLAVHQNGKVWEIVRRGTNSWLPAPGSQGIIDHATAEAIDETVHRFGLLAAAGWVERGEQHLDRYGFNTNHYSIVFELKNGEQRSIEFGAAATSEYAYAATMVDGQKWVFNFPQWLYRVALSYLIIPTDVP